MSKSLYLEKKILDAYFSGTALPSLPGTLYVALFTTSPTEGSDSGTEVSGGSYARKSITNNATNFPAATQTGSGPAVKKNAIAILFVTPTGSWGTIVAFGIYDASSGGNLLYWGSVIPNIVVVSGTPINVPINDLTITET
jgi:hypothetical protein